MQSSRVPFVSARHEAEEQNEGSVLVLAVPIIRDEQPIGAIGIWRNEPKPFSDGQIELLKTFADQAVIAIENVRLFRELEERNRAVTEALEQQTATSEILRVISSSPTDVQPSLRHDREQCRAAMREFVQRRLHGE